MKVLIINSQGHWINGWMTSPQSLEAVTNVLQKLSCEVQTVEVQSPNELKQILEKTQSDTLVWANAYWVDGENGAQHELPAQIEKHNLSMLGSSSSTLLRLLKKEVCQKTLKEAGIPVPSFLIIDQANAKNAQELIENAQLSFPMVVKPTNESRSQGVTKVNDEQQTINVVNDLLKNFPTSNIIIEEFLPNNDITCGFLKLGEDIMLLPSFNEVKGMDCSTEILSEAHYSLPSHYEQQVIIHDENILNQLKEYVPRIVNSLEISGVTRADARLDKNGIVKFFDINGMPGLNYPNSALIKQCYTHFPSYSKDYLFECLISTVVQENFLQNNMPIPTNMKKHHLFNLKSDTIITFKKNQHPVKAALSLV